MIRAVIQHLLSRRRCEMFIAANASFSSSSIGAAGTEPEAVATGSGSRQALHYRRQTPSLPLWVPYRWQELVFKLEAKG